MRPWPLLLLVPLALAQPKKPPLKDAPRVLMALPFGISPGKAARVDLRGLKLDAAKEARLVKGKGTLKLLKKEKIGVPNTLDAARVGDSRVEVELTIDPDSPGDAVEIEVATPGGSAVHMVRIDRAALVAEKEPNDGFKQAQPVKLGVIVQGSISRGQDVDVYRFEARAGQVVTVDVRAARLGGALDAFLSIHDAEGQLIDTCDDIPGSTDARIEFKAAKAGTYYATVSDAQDQGGPTHLYRLSIAG